MTFGKYKGWNVTSVLKLNPSYFGWCRNNVRWFKFSKRDYEIYLAWRALCQNNLQFTGYSDTEYLTKETCVKYLKSTKKNIILIQSKIYGTSY